MMYMYRESLIASSFSTNVDWGDRAPIPLHSQQHFSKINIVYLENKLAIFKIKGIESSEKNLKTSWLCLLQADVT